MLHCKFSGDYNSKRIFKIGQYLMKLCVEHLGFTFFGPPCISASEETRQYRYCDFCDDQGNWSQAVKSAASRESAVKINAAKPPRKSWLVVIFMTVGLPIHSKH